MSLSGGALLSLHFRRILAEGRETPEKGLCTKAFFLFFFLPFAAEKSP